MELLTQSNASALAVSSQPQLSVSKSHVAAKIPIEISV